jgi:hypothetical protein
MDNYNNTKTNERTRRKWEGAHTRRAGLAAQRRDIAGRMVFRSKTRKQNLPHGCHVVERGAKATAVHAHQCEE